MLRFKYTDGRDQDFVGLCRELDELLNETAGGEENRAHYNQYNLLDDIHDVVLICDDDVAIGCGSFKRYDGERAELKRVFIKEAYRGRGLSKKLVGLLEDLARAEGCSQMILETAERLGAAMGLYKRLGYSIIPNYPPYEDYEESICMGKRL